VRARGQHLAQLAGTASQQEYEVDHLHLRHRKPAVSVCGSCEAFWRSRRLATVTCSWFEFSVSRRLEAEKDAAAATRRRGESRALGAGM
jgi:hypothetical protein